jgi:flagellar M-ring protein FliF
MDSLNKAYVQLADAVRSMAPGTRLTAGALLAIVVVSLDYLFNQPMSGSEAYLLQGHQFTTSEIEAAQAALGEAGLNDYEIEGNQIRVPRALKGKYTAALADGDAMPLHFGTLLTDATTKPGPFTSRPQIDAMNKIALERTLADTIRWMKGIEKAAVLYHLPKKSGFRPDGRATAMVTVVPRGTRELDEGQVPKIRDLVAAAIGIDARDVTVVDANGRSYAGDKSDGAGVLDDPYFSRKKSYEDDYERKIRKALSYVPGVTVTAHVELEGHVARKERDARDHGIAAATSFTPKKVMVSVGVPDSYYEEIWRKSHPALDGRAPAKPGNKALELIERTEKTKIQAFVSQSIPQPDVAADVRPLVTVTTFAQLPAVDIPSPATTERALSWLSSHQSALGAISLMSVSLFILRSMFRSRQVVGPPASQSSTAPEKAKSGKPAVADIPHVSPKQPHKRHRRTTAGGQLLREELAEMVRDDPESAAKILRRWIGSAG